MKIKTMCAVWPRRLLSYLLRWWEDLGTAVTVRALAGAMREWQASRHFQRDLSRRQPEVLHGALVIADPQPRAFCVGLIRPRVYLSTGAVALRDDAALNAVLAHERRWRC